ncbi:MAG: hypothetical protein LBC03_01865 [Nitrososphaerota archaeon]|nr:hypothetical protein [Nitrososphaerota archaeon]
MDRENFFILLKLKLDPPENDDAVIRAAIDTSINIWKDNSNKGIGRAKWEGYLKLTDEIRRVMLDPNLRKEEAEALKYAEANKEFAKWAEDFAKGPIEKGLMEQDELSIYDVISKDSDGKLLKRVYGPSDSIDTLRKRVSELSEEYRQKNQATKQELNRKFSAFFEDPDNKEKYAKYVEQKWKKEIEETIQKTQVNKVIQAGILDKIYTRPWFDSRHVQEIADNYCKQKGYQIDKTSRPSSDKISNLYKLARRAREEGNNDQAFRKYEALLQEDPDNWEPNFYAAYYSGLYILTNDEPGGSVRIVGGRVKLSYAYRSGLEPCISRMHNCLDTVFSFIEEIQDYDEQKAAVTEVYVNIMDAAQLLSRLVDDEHQRMKREIDHYASETNEENSIVFKNMDKMSMGSTNNSNRDSYKRDISSMTSFVESRKKRIEEIVAKRRFDEYWDAHKSERADLESEKKSLIDQWNSVYNEQWEIPGYREMMNRYAQVQSLTAEKNAISFFKRSEKQAVQLQIDSVNAYIAQIQSQINPAIEAIQKRIAPLKSRVETIDYELTKPR